MSRIYFQETQKMRQKWVWVLMFVVVGIWIWGIIQQIFLDIPFGDKPASNIGLLLIGLIVLAPLVILIKIKLITEVRKDGLYYKMNLFMRNFRKIPPHDIEKYYIRTYKPIAEYGGWGIRTGWLHKSGRAFNMSGRTGLQLKLKNKKKILIGTRNAEDFQKAMDKMMSPDNQ